MEKVDNFFGVKYLIPYNRVTKQPYGVFRVIGSVEFANEIEMVPLEGGHSPAPWAVEEGQPSVSITATLREYPDFSFGLLENATITTAVAEASGSVTAIANQSGSSVVSATTGIAGIAVKEAKKENLPFGRLIFKATDTTKVTVYLVGEGDFDLVNGQVVAETVVPSSGGTVDLDDIGITITGGSGSVAFVVGDTAISTVRPVNTGSSKVSIGNDTNTTEFGLLCVMPKQGSTGKSSYIDVFRVKASGMPWNANSREWSEWTMNGMVLVDTATSKTHEIIKIEQ